MYHITNKASGLTRSLLTVATKTSLGICCAKIWSRRKGLDGRAEVFHRAYTSLQKRQTDKRIAPQIRGSITKEYKIQASAANYPLDDPE